MISVVIPTLNVTNYLQDAVRSVVQQREYTREIILVDNGSTDGTREQCRALSSQYSGFIHFLEEPLRGAPFARNTGLRFASGEWVQFLDADDILLENKFSWQLRLADLFSDAPFIAGTPVYQNLTGRRTSISVPTDVWLALMSGRLGNTTSTLFSKKYLNLVGGWDTSLSSVQDHHLLFELLKRNDQVPIEHRPVSVWRQRFQGQITGSWPAETARLNVSLRKAIMNFLQVNHNSYYLQHYDSFAFNFYLYLRKLATYDLDAAYKSYLTVLGGEYYPPWKPDEKVKTPLWLTARILGFYRTEWLRRSAKQLLPATFWSKIKHVLK